MYIGFRGLAMQERHFFLLLFAAVKVIHFKYLIVASASPSRFEVHVGLFRLLMKGIFDLYVQ